jgi:hypothetical protein
VPADVAEALAMAQIGIRTPVAIQVKPVGKYTEILAVHFGE